mgnify:CR=1 FL=1
MSFEKTNLHDLFKGEEAKQKSPLELAKEAKERAQKAKENQKNGIIQP